MSPLDSFWTGVMYVLAPLITPDWGKLVTLIPWLLLLLGLAYLAVLTRAWWRMYLTLPVRGPKGRPRSIRPLIAIHIVAVLLGGFIVLLAFVIGAADAIWTGASSPFGLVVKLPLLILGLVLVIGATGNAARLWERNGREDFEPDRVDSFTDLLRRHPAGVRRVVVFATGVVIAATGLALGTVPGWNGGDPEPVAVIPVLLFGLVLAVGAVGSAIAGLWPTDHDFDPAGDDASALVAAEH